MDESLLSISLAGSGHLVKMLITLEPHGILRSNFAYLYILSLSSHWFAKWRCCFAKHHSGPSRSFSEMLIALKPHSIGLSNFAYLYILTLSRYFYEKQLIVRLIARPFGVNYDHCENVPLAVIENANKYFTTRYNFNKMLHTYSC